MQKCVLGKTDVDERRLQVILQVLDASLEDAADETLLLRMFDHELLETAVLQDGDARFELFDVDDDFTLRLVALEQLEQVNHVFFPLCEC